MQINGSFSPSFTYSEVKKNQIQNIFNQEDFNLGENNYNKRIQELLDYQKSCQNDERYYDAEKAKGLIIELKQNFVQKSLEEKNFYHLEERIQVEKNILQEFVSFNLFWDQKLQDYIKLANDMKNNLIQKQQQQIEMFEQKFNKEIDVKFKESPQLLKLRAIQETLANYIEAGKIKQQIIQLEKTEYEKYQQKQKLKKDLSLQQIELQFQKDQDSLEKKKILAEDELRKLRCQELEKHYLFTLDYQQNSNQQKNKLLFNNKKKQTQYKSLVNNKVNFLSLDKYFLQDVSLFSSNIFQEKKPKQRTPTKSVKY